MLSATEHQNLLGMQKWDFKPLFCRALYGPNFENKHRWKAGPVTFVDENQLIRIAEETFKNSTGSRRLFPVSQNVLYFTLFYFCHTFPLSVWRPYCQVTSRVRRCDVRNFWPWLFLSHGQPGDFTGCVTTVKIRIKEDMFWGFRLILSGVFCKISLKMFLRCS